MTPERRTNKKPRRKGDTHPECLMKEDWATLHEKLFNFEESFRKYSISQTEINTAQNLLMTKLSHKIYGNTQNGMDTTIKLNRQIASSETASLAASMTRLWWLMAIVATTIIGNLVTVIFLALRKSVL